MQDERTLDEKYPRLNALIGLLILTIAGVCIVIFAKWLLTLLGDGVVKLIDFIKTFVSTTDKVIVVAMITGSVSIIGVVISSIVSKIVEYRYNVKKYLYDKREEPYKQFIEMIYTVMEDTRKDEKEQMSQEEMTEMLIKFSKGLTLWGSNRVVKKWLKYRRASIKGSNPEQMWQLEDIINEIRRDIGLGKKMKKGDLLSMFINDIENLKK